MALILMVASTANQCSGGTRVVHRACLPALVPRDDHRLANRGPPHGVALSQTVNGLSWRIKHGAPAELR
jgi:hypothetical protein